MATPANDAYPKPGFRDWALLAIGVIFVLMGLAILPADPSRAIVTIALFGLCTVAAAANIIRKLRFHRLHPPLRVEIVGGVPIKPSRSQTFISGASLAMLGAVFIVFGRPYGILFWSLGWPLAVIGCLIFFGLAVGWLPAGYLQFDPPGITFARRRWAYTIPWDGISRLGAGEVHNNPALFIWLHHEDVVVVHPPERKGQVRKLLASNALWVGAPVHLLTSRYGMDLPFLVQALERYVAVPSARTELSRKLAVQEHRD